MKSLFFSSEATGMTRPLPCPVVSPSPDAAPFWEAASRGRLVLPFCRACREHFFYPRSLCPNCGSREIEWVPASGRGEVYSFCIHHVTAIRELQEALPFVTALVTLDEGPRMMAYLVGVAPEPEAIRCGMRVQVTFIEGAGGQGVPAFRPAD